jgi:hypothetical protein
MCPQLPQTVSCSPDVLFRELEGEGVLLDLETERYFTLDDVGARMWHLLQEHEEVEAVVERLLDEYDVDETTLRRDLAELITKLSKAGLVVAGQV